MYPGCVANVTPVDPLVPVPMEELHSLDPRRQELLEARFTGAVTGNTAGSTGSTSGGAKVTVTSWGQQMPMRQKCFVTSSCLDALLKEGLYNRNGLV